MTLTSQQETPLLAYVTGAAGFIGSHLCDRLLSDGWRVVGIDNLCTGNPDNLIGALRSAAFTVVSADVSEPWDAWIERLDTALSRPNVVLHLASPASPPQYERLAIETMTVNALGTMHAEAFARASRATLVYASTSEIYGDPLEHPQRETYWGNVNPVGIRSCYDESKRFAESYLTTSVRKHGTDCRIVRIFNTYGPRMQGDDGRVIPRFCISALRGKPFTVYGDGTQTRSFCYVDDLVDGLVRLSARPGLSGRIVNLGNDREFTILQLAEITARLADAELRIEWQPLPADDPTRRRPDITLAGQLLDWRPTTALEPGLRRTLDYFKSTSWGA